MSICTYINNILATSRSILYYVYTVSLKARMHTLASSSTLASNATSYSRVVVSVHQEVLQYY